jgi:hypothetical protein
MLRRLGTALKRLGYRVTRFRLSTLLLLLTLVAVLAAWRRDHQRLESQLAQLQNPSSSSGWGVDQATGPPNTSGFGDISSAWASATQDGQEEWLLLEFDRVTPVSVHVHETYNPGAIVKITRVGLFGETVVWEGTDPTPPSSGGGVSKFRLANCGSTTQIKIYLDSPNVPGWNEIDAVALVEADGTKHWSKRAAASTSYGPPGSLDEAW